MLANSCSTSYTRTLQPAVRTSYTGTSSAAAAAAGGIKRVQQQRLCWLHATKGSEGSSPQQSATATQEDEEARIEALEASLSKAKSKSSPRRQIPIRNMTPKQDLSSSNQAEWKEGQLFPVGWEEMPLSQKLSELYLGRRGVLFWANQLAWISVWVLGGAWILFRVVGPALGLYKLQGDLMMPPM
jgi:hypothetical protein